MQVIPKIGGSIVHFGTTGFVGLFSCRICWTAECKFLAYIIVIGACRLRIMAIKLDPFFVSKITRDVFKVINVSSLTNGQQRRTIDRFIVFTTYIYFEVSLPVFCCQKWNLKFEKRIPTHRFVYIINSTKLISTGIINR